MWTIAGGVVVAWFFIVVVIPAAFWGFLYLVLSIADSKHG
jgi:hypothetical protein